MGIETLAATSLLASGASGFMGAMGAKDKADAEAASYNYKAQVAQNNAIIAKRNADEATHAGLASAEANDMKTRSLVGTQLVTQAANGLDVGSGTNVNVRESALNLGHLDTLTILHNAAKQSAGFKAQGLNFEAESGLDKASAQNAETAGDYAIASSLLGGASSVSDKWMSYTQKGVF